MAQLATLPEWLNDLVLTQGLPLAQAWQMWDQMLTVQSDEWTLLPTDLWPTAQAIYLAEMQVD